MPKKDVLSMTPVIVTFPVTFSSSIIVVEGPFLEADPKAVVTSYESDPV